MQQATHLWSHQTSTTIYAMLCSAAACSMQHEAHQRARQHGTGKVMAAYPYWYNVNSQQALCATANSKS